MTRGSRAARGHRSSDHALAITRNAFDHVVLECRSARKCAQARIISALGLTNELVYAETPDAWISRLNGVPIQSGSFPFASTSRGDEARSSSGEIANGSAETGLTDERRPGIDVAAASEVGLITAMSAQHALGAQGDVTMAGVGANPPHPDSLPVVERAISGLHCAADGEGGAGSPNAGTQPPHHVSVPVVEDTMSGFENSLGSSMEHLLSSISVSVDPGEKAERPELGPGSVAACVERAVVSLGRRPLLRPGSGRRSTRDLWAQVGGVPRLADRRLLDRPARAAVELGDSPRGRDARGPGAIHAPACPRSLSASARTATARDSTYFLDLGDPSGRAVAIRDQGWSVVDRPGVHFRRPEGLLPLPVPARDGSIDLLRPYVNLTEPDFRLMIAWLTAALRPVGPYPVLVLNGEQASGKSTLARILRLLIDPQTCPVLALPSSTENLMATAVNGWLLVYENISAIPDWLSDCVCQLAFGGGFASRTLFTNDERSVIYAQRPVILVGIDDFVVRGDLRDRSVFLNLPAIPEHEPSNREDVLAGISRRLSADPGRRARRDRRRPARAAVGRSERAAAHGRLTPSGAKRPAGAWGGGPRRSCRPTTTTARKRPSRCSKIRRWHRSCWPSPGRESTGPAHRRSSIARSRQSPAASSGHTGPRRSARSAANCAASLPSFACTDFPSTSSGDATIAS